MNTRKKKKPYFPSSFSKWYFCRASICLKLKNGTISKAQSKNIITYTVLLDKKGTIYIKTCNRGA